MVGPFSIIFALLLLFGGTRDRADLLDMLATDSYWQIQHITVSSEQLKRDAGPDQPIANIDKLITDLQSDDFSTRRAARQALEQMGPALLPQLKPAAESKDAEVAAVAAELIKKFSEHGKMRDVRRLMAIRTLGERKDATASAQLKTLLDSKELFVADYARRALAQIDGTPFEVPDQAKQFQQDVMLMPRDSGFVVHAGRLGQMPVTLTTLIDGMVDGLNQRGVPAGGMFGGADKPPDKKELLAKTSERLLALIERVGNVRLDGITAAFALNNAGGADNGWVVVTVRGKYDSKLMLQTLRDMDLFGIPKPAPADNPGDIPSISPDGDDQMTLLFPGDDRMIFVVGSDKKNGKATRDAVIAAVKNDKGTLQDNPEIMALLKTVDTAAPIWAVGKLTDALQKEKIFEAFVTFTLQGKSTKEGVDFVVKGQGIDAAKVKESADEINRNIQAMLPMIQQEVQRMPLLQPAADFYASIKAVADGKNAELTAQLKSTIVQVVVMEAGPMILSMLSESETTQGVGRDVERAVPNGPPDPVDVPRP